MKCKYGDMPTLGGRTKNKKCEKKATHKLGTMKGSGGKQFNHRSPSWEVCEEHRNKARQQYSTAYFTHERKIK